MERDVRDHIEAAVCGFRQILDGKLTGVYLHGSLAAGAFSRSKSDIDLLVVVEGGLSDDERLRLAQLLTMLSERRPIPEDIEMSAILEDDVRDFRHPLPFEFHSSASELEAILKGAQAPPGGRTDRDLAAHCTVTRAKGVALVGKPIRDVFGAVPHEDYLDAILHDLEWILRSDNILDDPSYSVLNICRVFQVLEEGEGSVPTKLEGGEWALAHLPAEYSPVIRSALAPYQSGALAAEGDTVTGAAGWDRDWILAFRDHALARRRAGNFSAGPTPRPSARILLIDESDAVLLQRVFDPYNSQEMWITPGGALEADERFEDARYERCGRRRGSCGEHSARGSGIAVTYGAVTPGRANPSSVTTWSARQGSTSSLSCWAGARPGG